MKMLNYVIAPIIQMKRSFTKMQKIYKYEDSSENFKCFQESIRETYFILILGLISKIIFFQYKECTLNQFFTYMKNAFIIFILYFIFSHLIFIAQSKFGSSSRIIYYIHFMFFFVLLFLSFINTYTYIYFKECNSFTKGFVIALTHPIILNQIKGYRINFAISIFGNILSIIMNLILLSDSEPEVKSFFISYTISSLILQYKTRYNEYLKNKADHKAKKEHSISQEILDNLPVPTFVYSSGSIISHVNHSLYSLIKLLKCSNIEALMNNLIDDKGNTLAINLNLNISKLAEKEYTLKINKSQDEISYQKFFISIKSIISGSFNQEIRIISIYNMTDIIDQKVGEVADKFYQIIMFSVSHEVNSQLNIIKGTLNIIKDPKYENEIIRLKSSLKILLSKIQLIKDYTLIHTQSFRVSPQRFSPKTLIRKLLKLANRISSNQNSIILKSFLNESTPALIECDYNRLFSSLVHILCNSLKYTTKGFIKISCTYEKIDNLIIFEIEDSGMGIDYSSYLDLKYLTMIDEENTLYGFKKHNSNKFLSGIGLKIISKVTRNMSGKLEIFSERNKGTRIRLKIPCTILSLEQTKVEDETCITRNHSINCEIVKNINAHILPNPHHKISLKDKNLNLPKTNILDLETHLNCLIVDDMPYNRMVLSGMINMIGNFNIEEASDGLMASKIALNFLKEDPNLLIFMDIDMPIMDGIESTKIIKSFNIGNPIIVVLTAFDTKEIYEKCLEAGANEFIAKPISMRQLKNVFEKYYKKP